MADANNLQPRKCFYDLGGLLEEDQEMSYQSISDLVHACTVRTTNLSVI